MGGYDSFIVENFYELRKGAEELARVHAAKNGEQEITLDGIYQALASTTCVTRAQLEQLEQLEMETECSSALGIPQSIRQVKELKSRGEYVVLISDMYLSGQQIRNILCRVDAVFQDIPIYASSDYGRTKGNGELYRIVKELEDADYSHWTHYGDNEHSDIKMASQLGIKAVHCSKESITEYEEPEKSCFHQISVGVSKFIRECEPEDVAGEIGGSLAGPILYQYVGWILSESIKRGINRLYFVARDGWILRQIADVLILARNYQIKTFYIYGSRKAWILPSFEGAEEDFEWILKRSNLEEVSCLDELAEVFQISLEELRRFLPENYTTTQARLGIPGTQIDNLCRQLQENMKFREYLVKGQKQKRELVVRYLQQEMDFSDDKFAFVELSGTGLTQKLLARLIGGFYTGRVRNFYFRLDNMQRNDRCSFHVFYPSNQNRGFMVELLCRAPHGQTEGYKEEQGKLLPVLDAVEEEKMRCCHLERYRDAVLRYAESMEAVFTRNGLEKYTRIDIAKEYMEVIASKPPLRIADFFCHMPFSSGGRKKYVVEFAPPVSPRQLRKIFFWGDGNDKIIYKGNALDYALAVSDKSARYKEKCLKYRGSKIGKRLRGWNRYLRTHLKPGIEYFCPWELLRGNIVIYGAGKVGQAYVKQAKQRYAKCTGLLWVDQDYGRLQAEGLQVESPEEIMKHPFDRIIISIHNKTATKEIWSFLRGLGVEAGKIYYG